MRALETDYLVIGAGAAGLAFADELLASSDADVLLVDRRDAPGGHWQDAYPFVRLHQPSAFYGVNSRPLGEDRRDDEGLYERASGAEVRNYFERVLDEQLLPTRRVRFLGGTEHHGGANGRPALTDRRTGEVREVVVRRKVVDARLLESAVPATHAPSFRVGPGARLVPAGGVADLADDPERVVVLGAGKTAMDTVVFLLDRGLDPDRIRWVRPRDAWLRDRASVQPLDDVGSMLDGFSRGLEAIALAEDLPDVFRRLAAADVLLRLDDAVEPTMYHGAIVGRRELEQLRSVRDVVRLGRVRRVEADRIELDGGSLATGPREVVVDATARGLRVAPRQPVFTPDRITLQHVRPYAQPFSAALAARVETTRDDLAEQNRLCPPHRASDTPADWLSNVAATLHTERLWRGEPDIAAWMERSRLNFLRGVRARLHEPRVQAALERSGRHARVASARLQGWLAEPRPAG